ncbi:MAG: hypothetical protein ACU0CI_04915 [Shimia sp.]
MSDLLRLSVPLSVWLSAFSAIYGLQGLICAGHIPEGLGRALLVGGWLFAVILQIALLLAIRRPAWASDSAFVQTLATTLAIVAIFAAIWAQMPVLFATTCG